MPLFRLPRRPSRAPGDGSPDVPLPGPSWSMSVLDLDPLPGVFAAPFARDRAVLLREGGNAGPPPEHAVLHLPGFRDYYFQVQYAQEWRDAGFEFAALEGRRSGRALRRGETPDDLVDLRHRHPEIAQAVAALRADGVRTVTVTGYGLGALTAALYAHDHPGDIDALVLCSPWLDHPRCFTSTVKPLGLVRALGRVAPRAVWSTADPTAVRASHVDHGGDFDFDTRLKPVDPFPLRAGAVAAVVRAIREVRAGLALPMPVLVTTAAVSERPDRTRDARSCEVLLDVGSIRRVAEGLGPDVTIETVRGGGHDLALSPRPARDRFLAAVTAWAAARHPAPGA